MISSSHPRQVKVTCDPHFSPVAWVELVLDAVGEASSTVVAQGLVNAALQVRYPHYDGVGSGRLAIGRSVYHVDTTVTAELVGNALLDLRAQRSPVLLVPDHESSELRLVIEVAGLQQRVIAIPLENFIAQTVIGLADDAGRPAIEIFQEIIEAYNRRVAEAEADRSLLIELN
jgi:hypothetical protein